MRIPGLPGDPAGPVAWPRAPRSLRRVDLGICLLLALAVLAVYLQVAGFRFIPYDDPDYVSANAQVLSGLSLASLRWAFLDTASANWHPLTWLSHMTDVSLFGPRPGAHHLVGAAFHLANSVLWFLLLRALTGSRWRSALVAGLFALHPSHVESVAWISERKDVLCAFFWILTTFAYLHHRRRPSPARYCLLAGGFALALMSKPMAVTLPVTLLVLDGWPLGRLGGRRQLGACALEKVPLLGLAALLSLVTILAQHREGAMAGLSLWSPWERLANALVATVRYLGMGLWPARLAIFYPHPPGAPPLWQVLGATALLGALTAGALLQARRRPWILAGWAWYLVTLAPVIGIIQVGSQALADRYTYLPFMGPFVVAVWGAAEAAEHLSVPRRVRALVAALVLGVLGVLAFRQTALWRNGITLFAHAQAVTRNNMVASMNLGHAYMAEDRPREAAEAYGEALRVFPGHMRALHSLAQALEAMGRSGEALAIDQEVLARAPGNPTARFYLAQILARMEMDEEAIAEYTRILDAGPLALGDGNAGRGRAMALSARVNLGLLLRGRHRLPEAGKRFAEALRMAPLGTDPLSQVANHQLALVLLELDHPRDAAVLLRQDLALDPRRTASWFALGLALARDGRPLDAARAYRQVLALDPGHARARAELEVLQSGD